MYQQNYSAGSAHARPSVTYFHVIGQRGMEVIERCRNKTLHSAMQINEWLILVKLILYVNKISLRIKGGFEQF